MEISAFDNSERWKVYVKRTRERKKNIHSVHLSVELAHFAFFCKQFVILTAHYPHYLLLLLSLEKL